MLKFFIFLILLIPISIAAQGISLNEIMASNQATITDEDGDTPDWIELYNSGPQIDLTGYSLSDDSLDLQKWTFEDATMESGAYLLIFASDKDRQTTNLHTNFKISADGEKIFLSDASGTIVDQIDMPPSLTDISYARETDGSLPWTFQEPSPNLANIGSGLVGYADPVIPSQADHFYPSSISVQLSPGDSDIYYTLDGSDPDESSEKYSSAISITSTTVLKAIHYKDGYLPSPVLHHTYFINEQTDLPVVSLASDPDGLFGDNGIFDNIEWTDERDANIEFFEDDKQFGFSQKALIKLHGSQSRNNAQKSLTVKFRDETGATVLDYPIFPGFEITQFRSILLRNSGNDFGATHIRDAFMQALIEDLDIDHQEYRPAAAFVNGVYWGIYNIREKISEHYIASHHNVDTDEIDLLENNGDLIHGDTTSYDELIEYISTQDMTTDSAYNYLNNVIDIDECLLYFAAQIYYCNTDWPGNNIKFWKERSENGKWRWILFGTEFGYDMYGNRPPDRNSLSAALYPTGTGWPNPAWSTLLLRKLVENPRIKNQFINMIADLLNTKFESDRAITILNEKVAGISSEISRHNSRWSLGGEDINFRMVPFAQNRSGFLRTHVVEEFFLRGTLSITVNASEGGRVKMNSLLLENEDFPFVGVYFADIPSELTAIPEPGYKFDGWSGAENSQNIQILLDLNRSGSITATFSPDTVQAKDIVINEINYNSSDAFDSGDWIEFYNQSDQSIDMSDWIFTDSNNNHEFIFPSSSVLDAGEYLVLVNNDTAFTSHFPGVSNYVAGMNFGLDAAGEFVKLVNEYGHIIDSLTYDDSAPWPSEADGDGATLELVDPGTDNADAENWRASYANGSPGQINTILVSVEENRNRKVPENFSLFQNYPNPFNPSTKIRFHLERDYNVAIKVFDVSGKIIHESLNKNYTAGEYSYSIKFTENLASGVYFYQLLLDDVVAGTKKMILIR